MIKTSKFTESLHRLPWCIVSNLLLVYLLYTLSRVIFIIYNYDLVGPLKASSLFSVLGGGLIYDTFAVFAINAPYVLLVLLLQWRRTGTFGRVLPRIYYVAANGAALFTNFADTVYFIYSLKRTSSTVFTEFEQNDNLAGIMCSEALNHWYLTLLLLIMIAALWWGYRSLGTKSIANQSIKLRAYTAVGYAVCMAIALTESVAVWPPKLLGENKAYEFTPTMLCVASVYNTPYTLLNGKHECPEVHNSGFESLSEAEAIYSPVHAPTHGMISDKKNVMIIIVESLSEEFTGIRPVIHNRNDAGRYSRRHSHSTDRLPKSHTPFIDSLARESLTFEHTYANGAVSIDALPSILSSLPRIRDSFTSGQYRHDTTPSLPRELKKKGYTTAFFHGAEYGSMGFNEFTKNLGMDQYYGKEEYVADKDFNGEDDYDGRWAIYDEDFLQFTCKQLNSMRQPFLSVVFTATSHHPYHIPQRYADKFEDDRQYPIYKCVEYTDYSLRQFFETAKQQPWYENTLFVITADHTCARGGKKNRRNDIERFKIPILFFDPSGQLGKGVAPGVAQQIDIMPTILGYLGSKDPYIAYGHDLLNVDADHRWCFNYLHNPLYFNKDYAVRIFNSGKMVPCTHYGQKCGGLDADTAEVYLLRTYALIYSCLNRMDSNNLTIEN